VPVGAGERAEAGRREGRDTSWATGEGEGGAAKVFCSVTCCLASMSWRSFREQPRLSSCWSSRWRCPLWAGARLGAQHTAGKGGDVIFAGGEPSPIGVVCEVID